ncbi:hypothetical protein DFH07DRAFT_974934 [Mycena maculata]|uniref:Uncharacterized protein n=1 Tax=Mycena maculata TaxID=230809 RepID=A0AAD7H5I2_9AGAR|nr:hypothetical protein DFH07DRAFT_974934 [Mycena maculata]
MEDSYNDSDEFIEDRSNRGNYLARQNVSRWTGQLPRPTFVFGLHASLDGPVPPFRRFGPVEDYPGDNPGPRNLRTGRYTLDTMSGSGYTTHSEDSRPFDGREDALLRQHALSTRRDRFQDEPYWRDARYDHRTRHDDRHHYDQRSAHATGAGRSCHNNIAYAEDQRTYAQEANTAHARGITPPPPPSSTSSRGPDGAQRIMPNPDLRLAPRGPDGHPQSAWLIRQDRLEPLDDDEECLPSDPGYVAEEDAQIERAYAKPLKERHDNPSWQAGNPHVLGRFWGCQIQTLEQALNLVAFMETGQQEAYELFALISQNLGAFPLHFRTEGEAHLMRHHQELERNWWVTVTGTARAPRCT